MAEDKAAELLNEFTSDYEYMASCLQIMNKRLVLLNPKFVNQKGHHRSNTVPPPQPESPEKDKVEEESKEDESAKDAKNGGEANQEDNAYKQTE